MSTQDPERSLTELEFVELAVRRTANRAPTEHKLSRAHLIVLLMLADELMIADVSQLDGGSDARLWELNRLRRMQT